MMKFFNNKPPIVKIGFLTLITVILWVVFDVYRALTVKPPPEVSAQILEPLSPDLDSDTLNRLQNRLYLTDEQIGDTVAPQPQEEAVVGVPSETPEPVATEGGTTQ